MTVCHRCEASQVLSDSHRSRSVALNELSDRRLTLQPDIYQRYSFLARLTDILTGDGSGPSPCSTSEAVRLR